MAIRLGPEIAEGFFTCLSGPLAAALWGSENHSDIALFVHRGWSMIEASLVSYQVCQRVCGSEDRDRVCCVPVHEALHFCSRGPPATDKVVDANIIFDAGLECVFQNPNLSFDRQLPPLNCSPTSDCSMKDFAGALSCELVSATSKTPLSQSSWLHARPNFPR